MANEQAFISRITEMTQRLTALSARSQKLEDELKARDAAREEDEE